MVLLLNNFLHFYTFLYVYNLISFGVYTFLYVYNLILFCIYTFYTCITWFGFAFKQFSTFLYVYNLISFGVYTFLYVYNLILFCIYTFYTCITWFGFAFTLLNNFLHFYTYWFVYGCGSSSRIPFQQQHQQSTHFSFYHVKVFQSQFRDKVKHSTLSQAAQNRIPGRFTTNKCGPMGRNLDMPFFEYTYVKVIFLC